MVVLRIALLIGLAWLLLRWLARYFVGQPDHSQSDLETVHCHQCGMVIPEHEAVHRNGKSYCAEHAPNE